MMKSLSSEGGYKLHLLTMNFYMQNHGYWMDNTFFYKREETQATGGVWIFFFLYNSCALLYISMPRLA